jgi:uncharacterized membrane protein
MRWLAALRVVVATAVGLATAAAALGVGAAWGIAVTGGWCASSLVFLVWVWGTVGPMSPEETEAHAKQEDSSRTIADLLLLGASLASLVAVGSALVEAGRRSGTTQGLVIGLAVLAVALGWATVHTVYTLRYSDLYYGHRPAPIEFKGGPPDYVDFAYLAFTIGMTFQVSDTALQTRDVRRAALRHALLSYLFGAVIVAVTINLVASLLNG